MVRQVVRTALDRPGVIEAMAQAVSGCAAGGGLRSEWRFSDHDADRNDGHQLAALPTRDAVIVALGVLLLARRQGVPVSQVGAVRHSVSPPATG